MLSNVGLELKFIMYSNELRNKVISELVFFSKIGPGEKSLKLSLILKLKRQTSGRHFGPVIQTELRWHV